MNSFILEYLHEVYGDKLLNPQMKIAFTQGKNKRLALIGDSILNLVVKLQEFEDPDSTTGTIDDARQLHADKHTMQDILNEDRTFTKYLIDEHECTSPVGKIGLNRADDFMEAIIGAIFLTKGYKTSKKYVLKILEHKLPKPNT